MVFFALANLWGKAIFHTIEKKSEFLNFKGSYTWGNSPPPTEIGLEKKKKEIGLELIEMRFNKKLVLIKLK